MEISNQVRNSDEMIQQTEPNPDGFFSDLTNQNACSVRVAVRFDHVFDQDSSQQEMFDICGKNLVLGCFAGYNATILAYGQTGSGKTHSMGTGSTVGMAEEHIGIVPRVFGFIFEELQKRQQQQTSSEFTIKCSFLELYNEELHDLLDPNGMIIDRITQKPAKELQIREEKNGSIRIDNLNEELVSNKEECLELLNKGISMRVTSATLMNEGSSRSHAIFTVTIEQKIVKNQELEGSSDQQISTKSAAQTEEYITAKFHFVDLAGSERIKKTGATGMLMKEGISINKGLLALGNVISALTEEHRKNNHIPYRDSKLTRILQDSLGGNSRTTMIACVSPAEINHEETLNSIKYASRARNIKNKPVINRDPNSVLIESLKSQIGQQQDLIGEYQKLLKDNNIQVPEEFAQKVSLSINSSSQKQSLQQISNSDRGIANPIEIRELKIQLSKKEKELKEIQDKLDLVQQRLKNRDIEFQSILKERDNLRIKNEILVEYMQKHELQMDSVDISDTSQIESLIDEYKSKVDYLQHEQEKKNQEIQLKSRRIAEMQMQQQRDEELLRKNLEENQRLKRQIKKFEDLNILTAGGADIGGGNSLSRQSTMEKLKQFKRNGSKEDYSNNIDVSAKLNLIQGQIMEDFNQKLISNLANHIGSMLVAQQQTDDNFQQVQTVLVSENSSSTNNDNGYQSIRGSMVDNIGGGSGPSFMTFLGANDDSVEEKERILEAVRTTTQNMQGELEKLMKLECDKKIQEIEKDLLQADFERTDNIKKASNDTSKVQQIEKEYKLKIDELNKKLTDYKDKEKKQEQVLKQLNSQEAKMKALEADLLKIKKSKDDVEKQMKMESEKFQKYKTSIHKELILAKKFAQDKDKIMVKLKQDLKKTDQIAQQKVAELRGMQKKAKDEKLKRESDKIQQNENKGIDLDRIKNWISNSTSRMINYRDMKDNLDKLIDDREHIQEDMLQEGVRLTELMLQKERKQAEMQILESSQQKSNQVADEGSILEIEQELEELCSQITMITDGLDSMEQTLDFLSKNINEISEDLAGMDADNIEPLQFNGLQSVDAAKVTLQTFFGVLLDLNVYKRDLETKCLEQDEVILEQTGQIKMLQMQIEELISKLNCGGLNDMEQMIPQQLIDQQNKTLQMHKEKAIKSIVESLEGYVHHDNIKHLNLTPMEQTALTKLSLSKIVSNLKVKLREEETRNFNLSHKLEQAINEKDQVKQKLEQLKKQQQTGNSSHTKTLSKVMIPPLQMDQVNNSSFEQSRIPQPKASTGDHAFQFKSRQDQRGTQNYNSPSTQQQVKPPNKAKNDNQAQLSNRKLGEKNQQLKTMPLQISQQHADSFVSVQSPRKMDILKDQQDADQLQITTYTRPKGPLKTILEKPQQQQQISQGSPKKISTFRDRRTLKKLESIDEQRRTDNNQGSPRSPIKQTDWNNSPRLNIQQQQQQLVKMPTLQERRNQRKSIGGGADTTGRIRSSSDAHFTSAWNTAVPLEEQLKNLQSPASKKKQLPNLQEKRKQRKEDELNTSRSLGQGERSPSIERQVQLQEINTKLDKIQESVHHVDEKVHHERRKSRAKVLARMHETTFQQQLLKNLEEGKLNESSFLSELKDQFDKIAQPKPQIIKGNESGQQNNQQKTDVEEQKIATNESSMDTSSNIQDESKQQQSVIEQESDDNIQINLDLRQKNKWEKDDLVNFNYDPSQDILIDFECINGKIVMVFQNFTIKEYDLVTKQKVNELNLRELVAEETQATDKIVAFAIDNELGLIAVACEDKVFMFDFQDGYSPVTKIDITNVQQLCFCQFFIIVMIKEGSDTLLVSYQIDDELIEIGTHVIEQNGSHPIILKSDNQFTYLAQNDVIQKLYIPELEQIFVTNTGHKGPIVDFSCSKTAIYTTSTDQNLQGFDIQSGKILINPVEDLECDRLVNDSDYLLTRCGNGAALLIWKHPENQLMDMQLIDEIELDQLNKKVIDFKMKGHIIVPINGIDYSYVIMLSATEGEIIVKALRLKSMFD